MATTLSPARCLECGSPLPAHGSRFLCLPCVEWERERDEARGR